MEPPSNSPVEILTRVTATLDDALLIKCVSVALADHELPIEQVTVLITDDEEVRSLNRQYRSIDEPTDVLTFDYGAPDSLIGDIAISLPYAERQAAARGVSLRHEVAFLAIHGALHLAGFDDREPEDRAAMVAEMNRVAALVGIPGDPEWSSLLHAEVQA
ncbi:MAG: rRNA maturation RNase YbeY [Armatimonadetes bacterium]|nr:rRNA maturation RNase YbeY [Armatimonadota bacterium]